MFVMDITLENYYFNYCKSTLRVSIGYVVYMRLCDHL